MDISMYPINPYINLVEIRYDGISLIFVSLFSFPRTLNKPELTRLVMMCATLWTTAFPVVDNQTGNL
jgi:hypothetical protein